MRIAILGTRIWYSKMLPAPIALCQDPAVPGPPHGGSPRKATSPELFPAHAVSAARLQLYRSGPSRQAPDNLHLCGLNGILGDGPLQPHLWGEKAPVWLRLKRRPGPSLPSTRSSWAGWWPLAQGESRGAVRAGAGRLSAHAWAGVTRGTRHRFLASFHPSIHPRPARPARGGGAAPPAPATPAPPARQGRTLRLAEGPLEEPGGALISYSPVTSVSRWISSRRHFRALPGSWKEMGRAGPTSRSSRSSGRSGARPRRGRPGSGGSGMAAAPSAAGRACLRCAWPRRRRHCVIAGRGRAGPPDGARAAVWASPGVFRYETNE